MFDMLLRAVNRGRPIDQEPLSDIDSDREQDHDIRAFPRMAHDDDASPGPVHRRTPYAHLRHATADFTEAEDDEESNDGDRLNGAFQGPDEHTPEDEDGGPHSSHVLPLFSASHLDSLPVYSIVHAMRIIVQARTETTLTWEQLRSPQVSQFLVKPMLQQIRTQHFSRATLYALMANCLQFAKEAQFFPGNAGTSNTRAKVCELLAIKLLKEYSTRELIDALSYDFNPLQGLPGAPNTQPGSSGALSPNGRYNRLAGPAARISTVEVAIRASAKHFLAHPLVVQQLEAIWNGAISFYSSADSLHRSHTQTNAPGVASSAAGSAGSAWNRRETRSGFRRRSSANDPRAPLLGHLHQQTIKEEPAKAASLSAMQEPLYRRTVTLYDPRNASLFKLSRLRVPRYRQFFSTCSLAVLIGLFLAVLVQHSSRITTLELVFWFWSAGFMLDELVGFNEQGFSLYIMSFWNIFDLGILLLLIFYYSLRICGVFLADAQKWNNSAYDILAANAILLLPRIFSVLDHYQYFSQLLIAFRLMAVDLAAVFILVLVSCSGFFVFFTLSHTDNDPMDTAYRIFQLLMGFTPAAWEVWPTYNILGKTLLVLFLIICHFVVVTILITVLTNSFMAIASNANEEHQFLFAINTISMVKNDALFSYVAPTNIFAWMLMPLRYCMPLPHFVALNRYVIKATHFPLLFGIFLYEKFLLAPSMYEPTDLVENTTRTRHRGISLAEPGARPVLFSPSIRLREESVVGFQKDRALDEVFRRTPDIATLRTQRRNERRKTQTAIRNWMDQNDGMVDSNYSTIDRRENEWQRRMSVNWDRAGSQSHRLRHMSEVRSTASDPADLLSLHAVPGLTRDPRFFDIRENQRSPFDAAFKDHTDAEGDDELITNDDEEEATTETRGITPVPPGEGMPGRTIVEGTEDEDDDDEDGAFFATPIASRFLNVAARSPESGTHVGEDEADHTAMSPRRMANIAQLPTSPPKQNSSRRALHNRALSTNTILYNPPHADSSDNDDDDDDEIEPNQSASAMFSPPSPKPVQQPQQQQRSPPRSRPQSSRQTTSTVPGTPTASGQRSPRKSGPQTSGIIGGISAAVATNAAANAAANSAASRPRPIMPPREMTKSAAASRAAAIFNAAAMIDTPVRRAQRRMSSFDTGSDVHSEMLTESAVGPTLAGDDGTFNAGVALPGSFTSQMALVTAMNKARATGETDHDRDRMSRLVLARMKTLEESFTDVVRELRQMKQQQHEQHREAMQSGLTSAIVSSSEGENSDQQHPSQHPQQQQQKQKQALSGVPSLASSHTTGSRPKSMGPAKSNATSASSTSSATAAARRGLPEPLRPLETPGIPRVPLPSQPPQTNPIPAPAVTPETMRPTAVSTPATVIALASPVSSPAPLSAPAPTPAPAPAPTPAPAATSTPAPSTPQPVPQAQFSSGGASTPKSPSGSRIPIVSSMSNLVSSPPGPGQLGRVSSIGSGTGIPSMGSVGTGIPTVAQRHLPRPVGSVSDFGDSESRMPRRVNKGKEIERDPVVTDDEGDSFFRG